MEIYCGGKKNEMVGYLTPLAKRLVKEVVREARRKIKSFYRLDIEIKDPQVIATVHYKELELKMRFKYSVDSDNANVILTRLPSANMEEEISEAVCSYSHDHESCVGPLVDNDEKLVDEKNGIAVFIIWEALGKGPLKSPSRCERRPREKNNYYKYHKCKFSLMQVCKGHEPKILFSDYAWSRKRAWWIENLRIKGDKIVVDHFTAKRPFSIEKKKKCEELTFDLYDC